ncbi:MAG: hypothetical protein DRN92_05005 [Thermoproteota archaeon]|nr:MAG: hypothetical protein DRN92_05005 [Candidatus Korarchaeota archaeon]
MKRKFKRYRLKSSESRDLVEALLQNCPELSSLFPKKKVSLEVVEFQTAKGLQKVFLLEGSPVLVELYNKEVVPYIDAAEQISLRLPKVIVDLGAVPHIANGADIMGPGIVKVEGEVKEGNLVLVADEKYGRIIAIGRALRDKEELKNRGKSVKNIHYAGDVFWKIVMELRSRSKK